MLRDCVVYKYMSQLLLALLLFCMVSCNPTRFLSENEKWLYNVHLVSTDKQIKTSDYRVMVRQEPNSKWFGLFRAPLGLYCLSSVDTLSRKGAFFRRNGEHPVVYDSLLTNLSKKALQIGLQSKGYLDAYVNIQLNEVKPKKLEVTYVLIPGQRYFIKELQWNCDDSLMVSCFKKLQETSLLKKDDPLDMNILQKERSRIVNILHEYGYYKINNSYVAYIADTIKNGCGVSLIINLKRPSETVDDNKSTTYQTFKIREVKFRADSISLDYIAGIRKNIIENHVFLYPDSLYRVSDVQNTYAALNALPALNYSSITLQEVTGDSALLDAEVLLKMAKRHAVSIELEGTNTNGDLGMAAVLGYTNRNLFSGSERFALKARGAYEAISNLEGYSGKNYIEYGFEASLRTPISHLPFMRKRRGSFMRITNDFRLQYNSQNRPEFHRRVLTANWAYQWSPTNSNNKRHQLNLLSLNYVFMPWVSETFRMNYLEGTDPRNSILRSSYEDLFIMSSSYTYTFTNVQNPQLFSSIRDDRMQPSYNLHLKIETAGNLLYGISRIANVDKDESNRYIYFKNPFSQYVRFEVDFTKSFPLDERNSFVCHTYFGIAVPYGNSSIVPYEKRFFSGGANSVRGWGVRTLGPGAYSSKDGVVDFVNQTGNLKIDLSAEWRTHLFWKLDAAAFIDAGNIWNVRAYDNQKAGTFKWNEFYKQIAMSYGLGLRFNLDYFVLRLDCGMKAINPVYERSKDHFPIISPNFSRDFALHFAVGLPF